MQAQNVDQFTCVHACIYISHLPFPGESRLAFVPRFSQISTKLLGINVVCSLLAGCPSCHSAISTEGKANLTQTDSNTCNSSSTVC